MFNGKTERICPNFLFVANVKKWEKTVADDDKDLEKLKKEEAKQMKVRELERYYQSNLRLYVLGPPDLILNFFKFTKGL